MKELRQPTSNYADIIKHIPKDVTVLDLGCGCGNPFKGMKFKQLVGVDIFKKEFYMPEYDNIIFHDINKIDEIFQEKSFDIVTCIDVIEHLNKEDGEKLFEKAEKIASQKVIFFTPREWKDNKQAVENSSLWSYGNPYNYHKSLWNEQDFIKRGYKIIPYQGYILAEKRI